MRGAIRLLRDAHARFAPHLALVSSFGAESAVLLHMTYVARYFALHDLPPHPRSERGYRSIGCAVCTRQARPGEGARAGRRAGRAKTECGIHLPRSHAPELSA